MSTTHFRRFRMHIDLRAALPRPDALPRGYVLEAWHPQLLERHAQAKYLSFKGEIDAVVFQSLSTLGGCRQLMLDITGRSAFVSEATWLLTYASQPGGRRQPCGTIQGVSEPGALGSLQNVGIAESCRGLGLGTHMLRRALLGFQETGHQAAMLEVTAKNLGARRLYERMGFCIREVVYRSVELDWE